jgi:aspartyl-tRNA(Asn)/glutamyl-tRNA(Gln) amidotransferase subunit C
VISREDVEHVARLTRLHLTPGEAEQMQAQLSGILAYIDALRTLDVEAVEPTSHAVPLVNVMREDEIRPSLSPSEMLANAPDPSDEFFRVPRILED